MLKLLMFLFAFIVVLPMVNAETQIFTGTVITDRQYDIQGSIFAFTYDESSNKVFVQNPSTSLIIENGKCNSNTEFKVCIQSANYSDRNITTYVTYYAVQTTIYKLTGSLTATSKISSISLMPKESAAFTITLLNPSELDIKDISYAEDFSPFALTDIKGCNLDGSTLSWHGILKSKFDKTCTGTLTSEKSGSYSLTGNLSYLNPYDTEKKNTDSVSITVLPMQLVFSRSLDNNTEANRPFFFNSSISNINPDEKMEVSIKIQIPGNIDILKFDRGFMREINLLTRSMTLDPGAGLNYSFYLVPRFESSTPFTQTFDYKIKEIKNALSNETYLNALVPNPVVNFSSEHFDVVPGQEFLVFARITNPSFFTALTDIKATLTTPDEVIVQSLDSLTPKDNYLIMNKELIAPRTELQNETIQLKLTLSYKFSDYYSYINRSISIIIKNNINTTSNATKIEAKPQQKLNTTNESKPSDSSKPPAQTIPPVGKKSIIFTRENLIIGSSIFAIFLAITFIISKIRNRSKGNQPE